MNFATFNFLSVKPCGWTLALIAAACGIIFGITAEAKMPAACSVVRVVGDISFGVVPVAGIGVTEKSAGPARGRRAGSPTFAGAAGSVGRIIGLPHSGPMQTRSNLAGLCSRRISAALPIPNQIAAGGYSLAAILTLHPRQSAPSAGNQNAR